MMTASACCDTCFTGDNDTTLPIACTLEADDFKERVTGIRALAARSLRSSRREPLQLILVYAPEALTEVQDLVAKESNCCSFMDFDLQHDAQAVRLTITAPIEALAAADELFAHFAPALAREVA
ncbi:hypothetical protein [Devosia riboflavina]|uniref:hypothetical protein n=1 Tax=Devosia riboflavina TaxID=46914 RepID=UPI00068A24EF|nr:hypothetical protein [Devosia riboflavina]